MTAANRDSKRKPKKDERPKLGKEKLKDLGLQPGDDRVKGGRAANKCTHGYSGCTQSAE